MDRINLDDTQESLADVIARVEGGETVIVTRGDAVVARIEPVAREFKLKKPIDFERLKRVADSLPYQEQSAGEFMRRLRDDARY
ncbi:type II toxin-antitoxin system Phd/YefM family antitoxin [Arvimicrobium flavum]|uniref:type II toxin-antitoxin system Phd/YefM family antitoxin n=1 Tax=Arvimicrobium flavum TaxID=3393320 RepID=UPI00237C344D|nr:type II toxin-antitoxin system prevent-host-death family antitoxin [Mesorhizobium shangrilense]